LKSQASTKNIPVIIVSASPDISKLALQAGANDSIEKPFEKKSLLNIVSRWIGV
jgi:FixJ family two-component response regulator